MIDFGGAFLTSFTKPIDNTVSHAQLDHHLNESEKKLALSNALRYFPKEWHNTLAVEFLEELEEYGHIYIQI